jgi:hypothetical protein
LLSLWWHGEHWTSLSKLDESLALTIGDKSWALEEELTTDAVTNRHVHQRGVGTIEVLHLLLGFCGFFLG